ncbi:MAG: HlyD family secretion protein [Treponema sp.]|jgi:HlyD family secretion protein|nr:HlyD family secretion protein [Treponema sp.]
MPHYGKNDISDNISFTYYAENNTDKMYSRFILIVFLIITVSVVFLSVGKIDVIIKSKCTIRPNDTISNIRNTTSGFVSVKSAVHGNYVQEGELLFTVNSNDLVIEKNNSLFVLDNNKNKLAELNMYEHAVNSKKNTVQHEYISVYTKTQKYFLEEEKLRLAVQRAEDALNQERNKHPMAQVQVLINEKEVNLQLAVNDLHTFRTNTLMQLHNDKTALTIDIEAQNTRINYLNEQIRKCEIKAPISGIYEELIPFNTQDYLVSGAEIARIIPHNNQNSFKVEIIIDPRTIAEIKNNLTFYIRFDSISPFEFGQVEGKITNVGADILTLNTDNSVFVSYGVIKKTWLENKEGYKVNLRTGMTGECRIVIKTKTIINYILEKIGFI